MGEGAQRDLGREKRHPGRAQRDPGREHRDLAKSTESREKEHRDPGRENRETPRESQPAERLRDYWGGGWGVVVGIRLGGRDTERQRYRDVEGHRDTPTHGGKRRKKLRQDRGPAMRTAAHTRTGRDAGRRLSELSGAGPSGHVLTGQIAPGPSGRGTRVGAGTAQPGPSLPSPRRRPRGVEIPNSRPAHPGTARAPEQRARRGRGGCGSPAGWEGAPVRRGRGLDPPGAGVAEGGRGPPPERVRAGSRGRRGGTQEGKHGCKRETLRWVGGRGLRLRCGGREGERGRKGKAARGGGELASRRRGGGGASAAG